MPSCHEPSEIGPVTRWMLARFPCAIESHEAARASSPARTRPASPRAAVSIQLWFWTRSGSHHELGKKVAILWASVARRGSTPGRAAAGGGAEGPAGGEAGALTPWAREGWGGGGGWMPKRPPVRSEW